MLDESTRSRESSVRSASQTRAANPRARAASSAPAPGPAAAITAFAASTGRPGTRSRSASAIPRRERCERHVLRRCRVPGAVQVRGPGREEGRLAEPCACDDARQPAAVRLVENGVQALARQEWRWGAGRAEVDARGRGGDRGGPTRDSVGGAHRDRHTIVAPACADDPAPAARRLPRRDRHDSAHDARVREDAGDVLVVPRLLIVGEADAEPVPPGAEA